MLSIFPRDVLAEIWDLIRSGSEGFPTYFCFVAEFEFARDFNISKFDRVSRQKNGVALSGKRSIMHSVQVTQRRNVPYSQMLTENLFFSMLSASLIRFNGQDIP